jgi:arylformamidase
VNYYRDIPDRAALELAYSPSSCVTNLQEILGLYARRSEVARSGARQFRTLSYGPDAAEVMDIFPAVGPQPSAGAPVLAYIHGGYWQELGKDEHSFPAASANSAGLTYIAINYGLAPKASLDEMVDRCRRAVLTLHDRSAEFGIDPRQIHLAGCSAGAQLAAMAALADWPLLGVPINPVRTLTFLSGVFDLRPLPLTYVNDALGLTVEDAMRNSPLLLVDGWEGELPPVLLAVGENETGEFKRQSAAFAEAVRLRGCAADLCEIPGRNHFDLVFDMLDPKTTLGAAMLERLSPTA